MSTIFLTCAIYNHPSFIIAPVSTRFPNVVWRVLAWRSFFIYWRANEAQFGIYPLRQPRQGSLVAAAPGFQQTRDFSRGFARWTPLSPCDKNIPKRGRFCRPLPPVPRKENKLSE